jgi:hypothetical protein
VTLHEGHLQALAEAIALEGNKDQARILKDLRTREFQCTTARRIRFLHGKFISGSTTTVTVTNTEGNLQDLTSKTEIENAILANNKAKLQQSFHLPFLQPPLRRDFGFKGQSPSARAVLAGVYECAFATEPSMQDFLTALKTPQAILQAGPTNMLPSVETYCQFWHKSKENTSCHPGPLSFATLKAGATDALLAEFECSLTRIPLKGGFSPER